MAITSGYCEKNSAPSFRMNIQAFSQEDLIIFSNGPGEISTWVRPVVEAVKKRKILCSRYRVILIVHPCQFSAGTEHLVAAGFGGIQHIIKPREYMKMLITGFGKKRYMFSRRGVIFSLGGDLLHPVLFRKRIRGTHDLYAYTNNPSFGKFYRKIFVRSEYVKEKFLKQGIPEQKIKVTGDLVYSSIRYVEGKNEVRKKLGLKKGEIFCVFLPGSRDFEVIYMLPVFLKVIEDILTMVSDLKVSIIKSPYVSMEIFKKALNLGGKIKEAESSGGKLVQEPSHKITIVTDSGVEVRVLEQGLERWGAGIDFAVTLPGTNTIQLAYRKIPALVVAALNKPELIPIEGPAGLLKWVPLIGKPLLKSAVMHYLKRFPFASLPNIYQGKEIYPELFGIVKTRDITEKLSQILKNSLHNEIKKNLSVFSINQDPAEVIIGEIWGDKEQ